MSAGSLYDGRGVPIGRAVPLKQLLAAIKPIVGAVLCVAEEPGSRRVARTWVLPAGGVAGTMPRRMLGELVWALDHDFGVAIVGQSTSAVAKASAAVMRLVGGYHG